MIGVITSNDPAGFTKFAGFLGTKPTFAHMYFDQRSPDQLWASVGYECQQAKLFQALGAQIIWSVPCPGAGQLEAINAGAWSSQYTSLFASVLAASPGNGPIYVRLPWEFNLAGQQNAAQSRNGTWNAQLFRGAWRILADLCRAVSGRFKIIWCPNVCTQAIDPETCYPGAQYVDIITQDFYMQSAYDKAGFFHDWYLNAPHGLAWGAAFADGKHMPYGISEWGMDSDIFAGDLTNAAAWLETLPNVHHHCWWDRTDGGINCQISSGALPKIGAAYKVAF